MAGQGLRGGCTPGQTMPMPLKGKDVHGTGSLVAWARDCGVSEGGLFHPVEIEELEVLTLVRETLKFLALRVAKKH